MADGYYKKVNSTPATAPTISLDGLFNTTYQKNVDANTIYQQQEVDASVNLNEYMDIDITYESHVAKAWYEAAWDWTREAIGDVGNALASTYATVAVAQTSILSGILDIGEAIFDGGTWVVVGAADLLGFDDAATDMREFISRDLVGEANQAFYENTALGKVINDASYMKYDSNVAQGIRSVTTDVAEIAAATALTIATGGATAPLVAGTIVGLGKAAESTYQTHGTDTTLLQEGGILLSGGLNGLAWMANGKLGAGALEIGKDISTLGTKQVFTKLSQDVTNKKFVTSVLKKGLASKQAIGNYIGATMMTANSAIPYITGEEELNLTAAAKIGGKFIFSLGLNVLEDGMRDYVGNYKSVQTIAAEMSRVQDASHPELFERYNHGEKRYGMDQASPERSGFINIKNTDWYEPESFKNYLLSIGFTENDVADVAADFTRINGRYNTRGYSLLQGYFEYIGKSDAEILDILSSSFEFEDLGYSRLMTTLQARGLSSSDAARTINGINSAGACSYAAFGNMLLDTYGDHPEQFREMFGFDLFTEVNGERVVNASDLITDMYIYANSNLGGGSKFNIDEDSVLSIVDLNAKQQTLTRRDGMDTDLINQYLAYKGAGITIDNDTLIYSRPKWDDFLEADITYIGTSSKKLTPAGLHDQLTDLMSQGKEVSLGIYRSEKELRFLNADGSVNISTFNWSEGDGHAVFITEVLEDRVCVSSWGEQLYIKFEDLIDNEFNINIAQFSPVVTGG